MMYTLGLVIGVVLGLAFAAVKFWLLYDAGRRISGKSRKD